MVLLINGAWTFSFANPPIGDVEVKNGLAVHLSATGDGELEKNLVKRGGWLVLSLTDDEKSTSELQHQVAKAGGSGFVQVATWLDRSSIPLSDHMANLVVADLDRMGKSAPSEAEIKRVLVPVRGVALVKKNGKWIKLTKPMPASFDEWTHFLHDATGNAVSKDSSVQVPNALRFIAGPRLQDSNGSNAWRVAGGVALHEWNYTISSDYAHRYVIEGRDAFNGTLLWQKLIASDKRMGGQSYKTKPFIVADKRLVYIDTSAEKWLPIAVDIYTGKLVKRYDEGLDVLANLERGQQPNLPQMNISKGKIYQALGRQVRCLDLATGKKLWDYTHNEGEALAKMSVAEDLGLLFAIEAVSYQRGHGKPALNWSGGRYPSAKGRALVAIRIADGKVAWRTPIDQRLIDFTEVEPWTVGRRGEKVRRDFLHLLNYRDGRLFTMYACDANHGNPSVIWALDAKTGKTLWVNAAGPHSDKQGHEMREMFNLFALDDGTLLTLGHAWCRLDQKTGKLLAFGYLGGNGRCDTHSCSVGLVTAGFGNFFKVEQDPTKIQWTRTDLARGMCGGRSTPAYGMTYHKGSGCGCFEPIRGNLALHRTVAPTPLSTAK